MTTPPVLRLAIFLPTLSGGGAERVMLNLARGFLESGYEVDVVVNRSEGALTGAVPAGAQTFALQGAGIATVFLRLARYLRRRSPAYLFTAMDDANVAALLAALCTRYQQRTVCSVHNTVSKLNATHRSIRASVITLLARLLYPRAKAVVAVSEGVAADLSRHLGMRRDQISVIANPVLTPEIDRLAAEPVAHPWFAPGALPVVLACGRLTEQKDYPTLLRAFAEVSRRVEARLVVLGEGEQRGALLELTRDLGLTDRVDFAGFAANPYPMMARCSVYVLSSRFEGSPVVLVEALKCGCRIVSTDCASGPRETLYGVPGTTLVPVGDVYAIAAAISAFLLSGGPGPGPRHLTRFDYRVAADSYLAAARRDDARAGDGLRR